MKLTKMQRRDFAEWIVSRAPDPLRPYERTALIRFDRVISPSARHRDRLVAADPAAIVGASGREGEPVTVPVHQPTCSVILEKNIGRSTIAADEPASERFKGSPREIDLTPYLGEAGANQDVRYAVITCP